MIDLKLKETELRVGYVRSSDPSANTLPRLASKLAVADQLRLDTFLRFEDKLAFALGRVLVQRILSDSAPEPYAGWPITIGPSGKPGLLRSAQTPDLRFSISHCAGLVVAVVALGRDVGIDAEFLTESIDYVEIARMHLPPAEFRFLERLHGIDRRDAFFRLWTLREAYVKATGEGLAELASNPHFSMNLAEALSPGPQHDLLSGWFFWQDAPTPLHLLAIASRIHSSERLDCIQSDFDLEELCL